MAWVLFAQQNTIKTAFRFSIINFYFVTAFYSLYDICMARQMIKTTILRYCMTVWAAPCPDGTRIYLKPTASSEGAPLWVSKDAHTLSWFREAGLTHPRWWGGQYIGPCYKILFLTTIETTFVTMYLFQGECLLSCHANVVSIIVLIICLVMQISYKE